MLDFVAFLAAVGPVALFVTKAVDFVRSFDSNDTWPTGLWIGLALVAGVGVALATGLNFAATISGLTPDVAAKLAGTTGQVLTGLAIGGTSCYWHEVNDRISQQAKAAAAKS